MDETLKTILEEFKVIPVKKNDKTAWGGISYKADKLTDNEYARHRQIINKEMCNNINYGILTGKIHNLAVIDFDFKNPEKHDVATAKAIYKEFKEILGDKRVVVKSQSGGVHLYFKYRPLLNVANAVKDLPNIPIDVRSDNGYIVAPCSRINNVKYELIHGDLKNIPEMPDEIFRMFKDISAKEIKKSKIERISKNMNILTDIELTEQEYKNATDNLPYFKKLINALPDYYVENYSDWMRIMIIGSNLYHASSNQDDKKHIKLVLEEWCKKSSKYQGYEVREWIDKTENHSTNKLSINSLWYIIQNENKSVFNEIQQEKYIKLFEGFEDLKNVFNPLEFERLSKTDVNSYDICKKYFELHYAFVQNDKSLWTLKPEKKSFCSLNSLKENFSNLTYQTIVEKQEKNEEQPTKKVIQDGFIKRWINDIERKQYHDAMVCFSNCPPNILNLFDGFYVNNIEKLGIKADLTKGQEIYDYITKTLFRTNKEQGQYLIKWLSQMFQQPKKPTNTALFLYGEKGCGKSTIFEIIAALTDGGDSTRIENKQSENKWSYSTPKLNTLFDRFNSKAEDKLIMCLEEAEINNKNGDSKVYAQTIKDAITNRTINIEKKYKEVKSKYSFARYMFISNFDTAVHIEDGDRRFIMAECCNDYSQESTLYNKKEKLDFWKKIYNLISDDTAILGFYKLLMKEDININWEHERPNGVLYEKAQRKNKNIFIKYFTTLKIDANNSKVIKDKVIVKYEINHLMSKMKKYYKEKGIKFNKNDFDEDFNKVKNKITIDGKPILKKIVNNKSTETIKDVYIVWDNKELNDWLMENNYICCKEDYDEVEEDILDELFNDDDEDSEKNDYL